MNVGTKKRTMSIERNLFHTGHLVLRTMVSGYNMVWFWMLQEGLQQKYRVACILGSVSVCILLKYKLRFPFNEDPLHYKTEFKCTLYLLIIVYKTTSSLTTSFPTSIFSHSSGNFLSLESHLLSFNTSFASDQVTSGWPIPQGETELERDGKLQSQYIFTGQYQ